MAAKKESVKAEKPSDIPAPAGAEGAEGVEASLEVENPGPPPPTFEQMWFDDPKEGREAQKLALELRENVELRAEPVRIFLEKAIVPLLMQGLQHLAKARPQDPAEYLAAFLLKNNPRRDMVITQPVIPDPKAPPQEESEKTVGSEGAAGEEKRPSVAAPPDAKKGKK